MRPLFFACSALLFVACGTQDASFTKLADPEPPAEDTSVPPEEPVEEEVLPEPPLLCPDRIYSAQPFTIRCLHWRTVRLVDTRHELNHVSGFGPFSQRSELLKVVRPVVVVVREQFAQRGYRAEV